MDRSFQVVILAAGYATGFRPLSLFQPKILAPVCNIGLLDRILRDLQKDSFEEATLVLRQFWESKMELIERQIPDRFRLNTRFLPDRIQGTVDCVRAVAQPGKNSLLVIYGDSLINTDFRQLVERHAQFKKLGGRATMLYHFPRDICEKNQNGRTYHGVVCLEGDQRICRFVEKPLISEIRPGVDGANAAVFVCDSELLEDPQFRSVSDFSFDLFTPLSMQTPSPLFGVNIGAGFRFDVGNIQRFFDINMLALKQKLSVRMPGFEFLPGIWGHELKTAAKLTPPCVIGRDARISGNTTIGPNAIVGDGVEIGEGSLVRDSIVLQGAVLGKNVSIRKSIIGDFSRVRDEIDLPAYTVCGPYSDIGGALRGD